MKALIKLLALMFGLVALCLALACTLEKEAGPRYIPVYGGPET